MEIGNKFFDLRKQNNFSQEDLADKVGVTRQTISKWELGETYPNLNQAKQLSKIFNVSLDDMVNNEIRDILFTKISHTEKLIKTTINILKIILLIVIILVIILVSIIFFREYYNVKPVTTMQSIECSINGINYNYEVWMNNETSYVIDKIITNDKNINIDTKKYINFDQIFEDIKANVISRGGTC